MDDPSIDHGFGDGNDTVSLPTPPESRERSDPDLTTIVELSSIPVAPEPNYQLSRPISRQSSVAMANCSWTKTWHGIRRGDRRG